MSDRNRALPLSDMRALPSDARTSLLILLLRLRRLCPESLQYARLLPLELLVTPRIFIAELYGQLEVVAADAPVGADGPRPRPEHSFQQRRISRPERDVSGVVPANRTFDQVRAPARRTFHSFLPPESESRPTLELTRAERRHPSLQRRKHLEKPCYQGVGSNELLGSFRPTHARLVALALNFEIACSVLALNQLLSPTG
jgi:hypothetical protein